MFKTVETSQNNPILFIHFSQESSSNKLVVVSLWTDEVTGVM
jgi:hypothetical protein